MGSKWDNLKKRSKEKYGETKTKWQNYKEEKDRQSQLGSISHQQDKEIQDKYGFSMKSGKSLICPVCESKVPAELNESFQNGKKIICELCGTDFSISDFT